MKKVWFIIICLGLLIPACSPIEMGRRVAGTSIQALEEEEKGRFAGIVLAGMDESYAAVKAVLQEKLLYIYLDTPDKGYITAMWFDHLFPLCIDTTEVGFFFKEDEPGRTRIDVVSLNSKLARFAAEMLFEALDQREGIEMMDQSAE